MRRSAKNISHTRNGHFKDASFLLPRLISAVQSPVGFESLLEVFNPHTATLRIVPFDGRFVPDAMHLITVQTVLHIVDRHGAVYPGAGASDHARLAQ